jgi:hypothetical protein
MLWPPLLNVKGACDAAQTFGTGFWFRVSIFFGVLGSSDSVAGCSPEGPVAFFSQTGSEPNRQYHKQGPQPFVGGGPGVVVVVVDGRIQTEVRSDVATSVKAQSVTLFQLELRFYFVFLKVSVTAVVGPSLKPHNTTDCVRGGWDVAVCMYGVRCDSSWERFRRVQLLYILHLKHFFSTNPRSSFERVHACHNGRNTATRCDTGTPRPLPLP